MKSRYFDNFAGEDVTRYDRERQLKRVQKALPEILTPQQHSDILRFAAGEKMVDIARSRGVNKSTVSRSVRRGVDRLRRILKY